MDGKPKFSVEDMALRQRQRRQNRMKKIMETVMKDRVDANYSKAVQQVSDATFLNTLRHDPKFKSIAHYALQAKRPLFRGELGMIGETVYTLEPAVGKLIAVPKDLKK